MIVLVCVLGVNSLELTDPSMAWLILIAWFMPIIFIIRIMIGINDERANRQSIDDYNTIRAKIVLTKFEAHELSAKEEYTLMECNSRHKNMITTHCRNCEHSGVHPKNKDCDRYGCEPVARIIG